MILNNIHVSNIHASYSKYFEIFLKIVMIFPLGVQYSGVIIYILDNLYIYPFRISSNLSTNKKTSEYKTLNMESTNLIDKNILQYQSINLYFSTTKNYIFPSKENSNR